jgi:hypothetical protein
VDIIIKEIITKEKDKPKEIFQSIYLWLALIIIILLIILSTIFIIIYSQRKKRRLEAQPTGPVGVGGDVLHPVDSYLPTTPQSAQLGGSTVVQSTQLATAPAQELLGPVPTATGVATAAQTDQAQSTQLPPVGVFAASTVQPGTISTPAIPPESVVDQEQKYGIDKLMTPEEKIALLEERLVFGEIDEDVYLALKAKYEMEAQPYQPAPQLPPAPVSVATVQPEPSVVQPQQPTPVEAVPIPEPTHETVPPSVSAPTTLPVETVEPTLPPDLPADAYQQPQLQAQQPPPTQIQQPHVEPQPQAQPQPQQPSQQIQQQDTTQKPKNQDID